jgi:hypothetical protein
LAVEAVVLRMASSGFIEAETGSTGEDAGSGGTVCLFCSEVELAVEGVVVEVSKAVADVVLDVESEEGT